MGWDGMTLTGIACYRIELDWTELIGRELNRIGRDGMGWDETGLGLVRKHPLWTCATT